MKATISHRRRAAILKTYYFDATSGNDTNRGTTPDTPKQTIAAANGLPLKPGERVLFKLGETFAGKIAPTCAGKTGKRITYGTYGSGARPIIDGSAQTSSLAILSPNYHNLRFEGLDFAGSATDATVQLTDAHDLYFYDCIIRNSYTNKSGFVIAASAAFCYNILVESCTATGNYKSGFLASNNSNVNIRFVSCTAYSNGHSTSADHGFYVSGDTIIDKCTAYSNTCGGFKLNDNEVEPFLYPVLKNSTSYSNYVGIIVSHKNATVYNNLSYINTYANIHIYGNTWGGYTIVFNTFSNGINVSERQIQFIVGISANSVFKNNIICQAIGDTPPGDVTRGALAFSGMAMADYAAMCDYNLYYISEITTSTKFCYDSDVRSWANWQAAGGDPHGTFLGTTVPGFVTRYSDYHAAAAGNLLSTGVAIAGFDSDKDGGARGATPTCGCYEDAS